MHLLWSWSLFIVAQQSAYTIYIYISVSFLYRLPLLALFFIVTFWVAFVLGSKSVVAIVALILDAEMKHFAMSRGNAHTHPKLHFLHNTLMLLHERRLRNCRGRQTVYMNGIADTKGRCARCIVTMFGYYLLHYAVRSPSIEQAVHTVTPLHATTVQSEPAK